MLWRGVFQGRNFIESNPALYRKNNIVDNSHSGRHHLSGLRLGLVARGDPATNRASADPNYIPTEEEIQELRAEMGLDDPILVQYGAGSGTQPTVI